MEVSACIENPQVFAGDTINISVEFRPSSIRSKHDIPVLLSGYALVQGFFRLGDMVLSEPFAAARKCGVVLSKRGLEYGQPKSSNGILNGVLDGLKNFMVSPAPPTSPRGNTIMKSSNGTSVSMSLPSDDDGDYPIFATSQLLLFTDLNVDTSHKFNISVDLPESLPSTYRSRSLQITYQFVVGFERLDPQRINKPTDTKLFLNFRLLPKPPTSVDPIPKQFDLTSPINAAAPVLITNRLVDFDKSSADKSSSELPAQDMDAFIDQLLEKSNDTENINRRRSSSIMHLPGSQYTKVSYDINRNGVTIAQLLLSRPAINIGDVLSAQLIFSRPCLHVSVFLEMEETISDEYAAVPSSVLNPGNNKDPTVYSIIFARQNHGTYGLKELPIYLPTLTSIAPRLDTEQVSARWCLRLDIVCLVGSSFREISNDSEGLVAKNQIDHESFSCKIPVYMLPPNPPVVLTSKTWRL